MESSLSMPELTAILEGMHKVEERQNRFTASLHGHDIGGDEAKEAFEKVKNRVMSRAQNNDGNISDIGMNIEVADENFSWV